MVHLRVPHATSTVHVLELLPGVPIFFMISGFLVSGSWDRSLGLRDYAFRRSLRIFPGLWCCVLVSIVTFVVFGDIQIKVVRFAVWLGAQLSIGQFYNPAFLRGYGVGALNGSLWTIPVELQFYIVLPLIFGIFTSKRKRHWVFASAAFLIAATANRFYYMHHSMNEGLAEKLLGVTLLPHIYFFLLGVVAYGLRKRLLPLVYNRWVWWLGIYCASAWLLAEAGASVRGNGISPLLAPLLGLMVLSGAYSKPMLARRILGQNDISYGTYIYHMLIINVLVEIGFISSWTSFWVALLGTILIATLSWVLVERPSLALKRRFAAPSPSGAL